MAHSHCWSALSELAEGTAVVSEGSGEKEESTLNRSGLAENGDFDSYKS